MQPNPAISYELVQARISDLHHQARRDGLARAAARSAQPERPRVPGRLRLRLVHRHRTAAVAG